MSSDFKFGIPFLIIAMVMLVPSLQGGIGLLFVWPSISFAVVSGAHLFGTVTPFGKRSNGTRQGFATLLLLPYLVFARLVWTVQIFCSREPALNVVNDSLIIARRLRSQEFPSGVVRVCDVTSELVDPVAIRMLPGYRCDPILDANGLPPEELATLVRSLRLDHTGPLLIHCANGHGRSGMVAAAWLIDNGFATSIDTALELLRSKRPRIHLRQCQQDSLEKAIVLLRSSVHR